MKENDTMHRTTDSLSIDSAPEASAPEASAPEASAPEASAPVASAPTMSRPEPTLEPTAPIRRPTKSRPKPALDPIAPIRRPSNKVQWYALYTAPRAEKKVAERFTESGIEHYLPIQKVMRKWSDRMKEVEVPVVNGYIFVYISELQFRAVLNTYGAIQFVREFGKPVPIPDKQLARLRFMVDNAEAPVEFNFEALKPGQPITITRGPLQGLIGELQEVKGKHHVIIRLDKFGYAITEVPLSFIVNV